MVGLQGGKRLVTSVKSKEQGGDHWKSEMAVVTLIPGNAGVVKGHRFGKVKR